MSGHACGCGYTCESAAAWDAHDGVCPHNPFNGAAVDRLEARVAVLEGSERTLRDALAAVGERRVRFTNTEDFPPGWWVISDDVLAIVRAALASTGSPLTECVCAETSIRNCPEHGQGEGVTGSRPPGATP